MDTSMKSKAATSHSGAKHSPKPTPGGPLETTIRSEPIPFDTAVDLVHNFLNELPTLAAISIGGTLPAKDFFTFDAGFVATQFWFCFNPLDTDINPPFFLSWEKVTTPWNSREVPEEPASEFLDRPLDVFEYTGDDTSRPSVYNFLLNHTEDCSNQVQGISKQDVKRYSQIYKALFGDNEQNYCKYPLGYFVAEGTKPDQKYFKELLEPRGYNVKFIRYYIGLADPSAGDEPNRIRIVLFPVDENGKNIVVLRDENGKPGVMIAEPIILQKSFPPPPNG